MNKLTEELREEFRDKEYAHAYADDFLNAYIATQIKTVRQQQNLSQEELANLAEMKQERISVLEDVNYSSWSVKTLKRLARAFDLTLVVSFEEFSKRIGDISNFDRKFLERNSREKDLSAPEILEEDASEAVIALEKYANKRHSQSALTNQNSIYSMPSTGRQTMPSIHFVENKKNTGAAQMAAGGTR